MRKSRESVTAAEYESAESADLDQLAFLVEIERFLELEAGWSEGSTIHLNATAGQLGSSTFTAAVRVHARYLWL